MTSYQTKLFCIIATAWFFDSMDLGVMTFILGSIKAEFGLSIAQTGIVASASFLGMLIGAAVAGVLADRFGRKPVFQVSMVFWGIGSLFCGLSTDVNMLIASRIVLGFGMGMEFPVGLSIVSEIVPSNRRGRYLAILEGFWPIGFICSGLLSYLLLEPIGWRGIFFVLAVPAVFVFYIRRHVPESPRWLSDSGQSEKADSVMTTMENHVRKTLNNKELPPIVSLPAAAAQSNSGNSFSELWKGEYGRRTLMLWILWFFALMGYYGLTSWLGALLQQAGYEVTKSVQYTVTISLAGIPGFIFASWIIEKIGRKPTCVLLLLGSAVSVYIYGHVASVKGELHYLMMSGMFMQFCLFGMWSILYAYTPELYPTRIRATGAGFASSIGRLGSFVGPFAVGFLLPVTGQTGVFTLGAASFVIAAAVVVLLGVETRGRALEDISG
jgi:putative MFS transporter